MLIFRSISKEGEIMKKVIIIAIILMIATPALARHTCKPYIKKYWRSSTGRNTVLVGWSCKGSGNGFSVRSNDICAITDNGTRTCADGYQNLVIKGGSTKLTFDRTEYPISKIYIKK